MLPKTINASDVNAIHRFIGGRRRYNALRQFKAITRRAEVIRLLREGYSQVEIARQLGWHRSTISKDVALMLNEASLNRSNHWSPQSLNDSPREIREK